MNHMRELPEMSMHVFGKELVKLFIIGLCTNHTDSMAESNFILFGFLKDHHHISTSEYDVVCEDI